jgi:hypothetical protein
VLNSRILNAITGSALLTLVLYCPLALSEIAYLNPLDAQENLQLINPEVKLPGTNLSPTIKLSTLMVSGGFFRDGGSSVNDSIRANVGVSSGRYYWEIRVIASKPENSYNSIGFATAQEWLEVEAGSTTDGCSYERNGSVRCYNDSFYSIVGYNTGDVIGLALDLDSGKLYIRKNSIWILGNPDNMGGGLNITRGKTYYPMLTLSEGDSFLADFGQINASHNAPNGYIGILEFNAITVTKFGTGNGTVTSSPAGIDCGTDCNENYTNMTNVTLTATPTTGSAFVGWSGECSGTNSTCTVTMNTNKTATATFNIVTIPTVTTNAASNITVLGATLNGVVNNGGVTTTVSFDLGPTVAYGTNIAATPASIAGTASNVAVSASKIGLNCNTLYHYRVKAVNNSGTKYGLDKTFTTLTCPNVDLVVTSITFTPAAPAANGIFAANVTVKNQGTVSGDGKNLDVWPHLPTVPTCGAVGTKRLAVGTLAAGATKTLTFTALSAGTAGAKRFRAFVDSGCTTAETNKSNNQTTAIYAVNGAAPAADFVVTAITLTPATPVANGTFNAAVTVKNQGTVAGDGKNLDVWPSLATAQACGAVGTKRMAVGTLAAGATKILTFTGLAAGTAGAKAFRTFVDSGCGTTETNEGNNQMTKAYTVQ